MRRCGAISQSDGSVSWRVWAPRAQTVDLVLLHDGQRRVVPMRNEDQAYFTCTESVPEGQRYAFSLDGGDDRQDPCSLWQPQGVPGTSAVVDPRRFNWSDSGWKGTPRESLVIYELHVGTFTPEGTFEAVIPRLHSLRELGVTALEIMPVAQFPGGRNWGYDGVLPYATQNTYGGPHGFQKLIDAAHAAGLAVILDVVYNHLGPEGNFVHEFGPYFTDKYKTPWGQAVNYDDRDSEPVREWVLDNVRMWLEEFHLDGLRLDAVHAIYDLGARHILRAIQEVAEDVASSTGRLAHIIAESDLNDPRLLHRPDRNGYGLDAQWSDDFHHVVHSLLTGEGRGYYADYGQAAQLANVMTNPFVYAGHYSSHRGRRHGAPADGLTGDRFVVSIQNHDQVGNRATGDRLGVQLACPAKQRLAASLMLLSPYIPLLFMGEEYGEPNPFPFFCSFQGAELVKAVREGRRREFAGLVADTDEVPDPGAKETFASAKLSWSWPEGSTQAGLRRLYQDLLAVRRTWPALRNFSERLAQLLPEQDGPALLELVRGVSSFEDAGGLQIYFNLTERPRPVPAADRSGAKVLFSSESARYAGARGASTEIDTVLPYECVAYASDTASAS